ncbi:MAG: glycosyltransferase family 39 protein [Pseudomonadota bacterium]
MDKNVAAQPAYDLKNLTMGIGGALLAVGVLTIARIVILFFAEQDLFFDEAQYWFWSTSIEGGYFSKPPGLAVVIATTTGLCGDSEACIRVGAPVLYALAAGGVGLLAARMAGTAAGCAAALLFLTIPGVSFGARLISTDAPLLVCWAAALYLFHRYLETRSWMDAILLGAAVGLGFLAKYAMVYFGFCLAVHALIERRVLDRLTDLKLWVGFAVAVLVFSPNLIWNLQNGAVTLAHTADNASWGGALFNPDELAEFSGAQIGILGPVLFGILVWGLWRFARNLTDDERFLLAFSVPITATMCLQALISRANANWAALSFVAFVILAVVLAFRLRARAWLAVAFATHLAVMVGFAIIDMNVKSWSMTVERTPFKRVLGWADVSDAVRAVARDNAVRSVVSNSRSVTAQLTYYLRDDDLPVHAWLYSNSPRNHYEQVMPATADIPGPILVVTRCGVDFGEVLEGVRKTGNVAVPIARARERTLYWAVMDAMPADPPPLADCRG